MLENKPRESGWQRLPYPKTWLISHINVSLDAFDHGISMQVSGREPFKCMFVGSPAREEYYLLQDIAVGEILRSVLALDQSRSKT